MKKRLLALAVFTGLIGVWQTGAFATNGDNLIGITPNSEAMGGIGVGMPVGSVDSIFRNPAWMNVARSNKFQFGGIIFMPSVKAENDGFTQYNGPNASPTPNASASVDSNANLFLVPEVGIVDKINDKLVFGIGAFGVSGLGVDYNGKGPQQVIGLNPFPPTPQSTLVPAPAFYNMRTTLQFLRIIPALSYQINPMISVGAGIDFAYGSLDINATLPNGCQLIGQYPNAYFNCTSEASYGGGQSTALGIGGQLGVAFNFGNFVYAGLSYQTPISLTYRHVFDFIGASRGNFGNEGFQDFKLEQPQEIAFGVGVAPTDKWNVGADVRWINWSNADGYKDFGWKDQYVFALGTSYKLTPKLTLRAGFNYARSPIRSNNFGYSNSQTTAASISGANFNQYQVDFFNLYGFPAITEEAITLGGSYQFTNTFGVSLAYEHDFQHSVTDSGYCYNGGLISSPSSYNPCSISAKNAEDAINLALEWRF